MHPAKDVTYFKVVVYSDLSYLNNIYYSTKLFFVTILKPLIKIIKYDIGKLLNDTVDDTLV